MNLLSVHQWLYERSGGRLGHRLISLRFLLLRTTGRRTGQPRTVTLAYAREAAGPDRAGHDRADDDRADYLVVASNYGSDRPPGWLLNITADPRVQIQDGPRRTGATARILSPGDPGYERLWQLMNDHNHGRYRSYQAKTRRPIPVVVLTPAGPAAP
ncbi:MAG: nitroreductase family deazaflavin-dependent oxidoreductase [Streptosporangiaceae bacterium]